MRLLPMIILEIENVFKELVDISLQNVEHAGWLHLGSYDKVLQERYELKIELVNFQAEFREDFSNPELDGWENETLSYFQPLQIAKNSQLRNDLKAKTRSRVLP